MNGYLYGRKYRVLVVIDEKNTALDVSELQCSFKINKRVTGGPNTSECTIYNLSADGETQIVDEGHRLIIEAGYESQQTTDETIARDGEEATQVRQYQRYGIIFDGDIFQPLREREDGVTYKLIMQAIDGDKFNFLNKINVVIPQKATPRTVINTIASSSEVPIEISKVSEDIQTSALPRGKVLFGNPAKYLDQVSSDNKAMTWIEDGKLNVVKFTDPPSANEAIIITPENGMVGVPQQTNDGVSVKCLMDPRIKLGGLIKIDNSLVRQNKIAIGQQQTVLDKDGLYFVQAITHEGDTRGNDWHTTISGVSMGLGKTPLMMQTAQQTLR